MGKKARNNSKEVVIKAKDGLIESQPGIETWFVTASTKLKTSTPLKVVPKESAQLSVPSSADELVLSLLNKDPQINASTFLNLLKSNGITFHVAGEMVKKDEPKVEADSTSTAPAAALIAKESSTLKLRPFNLSEADVPKNKVIGFSKFKCILLQEGMGNFGDSFYYSKEAIASAVPIFEGKKIYADHPSALEEETRPERSVRDVLGYFENVHMEEDDKGRSLLCGEVTIMPDEEFAWARSLMREAVEYAKKFPDKDLIGLSIAANGDAEDISIDDLLTRGVPETALPKVMKAKEEGITNLRLVSNITDAVSCDMVTEAGAGGKITELLEGNMSKAKDKKADAKVKENEIPPKAEADGADAGHDDAAKDKELIMSMMKKHMGDAAAEPTEEECGVVKEAYEGYKEMGHKDDEAMEKAVSAMKLAKHMASKKEAAPKDDPKDEPAKESMDEGDEAHKEANIKLRAENAALKESIRKVELKDHIEKVCKESKLPNKVTTAFREGVETAKSKDEVDKAWKLFEKAFKASGAHAEGDDALAYLSITPEKTTPAEGGELDFSDCIIN